MHRKWEGFLGAGIWDGWTAGILEREGWEGKDKRERERERRLG